MPFPLVDAIATLVFTVLMPPFAGLVLLVVILASVGKTIGIRLKYVEILLYIFEFGKKRLAKKRRYLSVSELSDEESENRYNSQYSFTKETDGHQETHEFQLSDSFEYLAKGMQTIVDDEVTKRFTAEELTSWNFLTRTNHNYEFISVRLTIFWVVGFIFRYFFLLPLRICILSIGMGLLVVCTYVVGSLPNGSFKRRMNKRVSMSCFDFLSGALSLVCRYHNQDNIPCQGICVANHTSPMDVLVLACDNAYDMVGQRHGGFLGIFQRALSRASDHIWFERGEVKDRFAVARRLKSHIEDPSKMPILIFPEGTCINNTSVMQFKKGTFEVGGIIYPVAIKYDPRFGDAFWNSSKYSMLTYLYMMMTSWAIVCDVWYLPPMTKKDTESSIEFANRVKAEIAKQGGLVDLLWDGALKRSAPKKELKEYFQQEYSKTLKLRDDSDDERRNGLIEKEKEDDTNNRASTVEDLKISDIETSTVESEVKPLSPLQNPKLSSNNNPNTTENHNKCSNSVDNNSPTRVNGIELCFVNGNDVESFEASTEDVVERKNRVNENNIQIKNVHNDIERELKNRHITILESQKENVPNNISKELLHNVNHNFINCENKISDPERTKAE